MRLTFVSFEGDAAEADAVLRRLTGGNQTMTMIEPPKALVSPAGNGRRAARGPHVAKPAAPTEDDGQGQPGPSGKTAARPMVWTAEQHPVGAVSRVILEVLKQGPMTRAQLVAAVQTKGLPEYTDERASAYLSWAKTKGLVKITGNQGLACIWALA